MRDINIITKDDFERYEEVRESGRTNMFMVSNVEALSGLDSQKIYCIMEHYSKLKEKFANCTKGKKDGK